MAVLPSRQDRGVRTMIMKELKVWMDANMPESGTVLSFADGQAEEIYKQYGFVETYGLPLSSVELARRC